MTPKLQTSLFVVKRPYSKLSKAYLKIIDNGKKWRLLISYGDVRDTMDLVSGVSLRAPWAINTLDLTHTRVTGYPQDRYLTRRVKHFRVFILPSQSENCAQKYLSLVICIPSWREGNEEERFLLRKAIVRGQTLAVPWVKNSTR